MLYRDLDKYRHGLSFSLDNVFTVGWLDVNSDFTSGRVDPLVLEKLKKILVNGDGFDAKVNAIRGYSPCEHCGEHQVYTYYENTKLQLGFCEIWLKSSSGIYYACPSMLIHHIEVHNYLPPDEFLVTVMNNDLDEIYNAQNDLREMFKQAKSKGLF